MEYDAAVTVNTYVIEMMARPFCDEDLDVVELCNFTRTAFVRKVQDDYVAIYKVLG